MAQKNNLKGHLAALLCIFIWGTTFISTKVLLKEFAPVEILFFRFIIGYVTLLIIYPKRAGIKNKKHELMYAAAGLCGVTLYFLMENVALTYSLASNVGVIVSAAPFFTFLFARKFLDGEKLGVNFLVGFITAMAGIGLISFNGSNVLKLNPIGDILALGAAVVWAVYSVILKKTSSYGDHIIQSTRKVFFYGLIFMMPVLFLSDFQLGFGRFIKPVNILNILFLGFAASALCFAAWNFAVNILGAVKTSVYIYLVPVITVVTSVIVLNERVTVMSVCGTILTLAGLFISEHHR